MCRGGGALRDAGIEEPDTFTRMATEPCLVLRVLAPAPAEERAHTEPCQTDN